MADPKVSHIWPKSDPQQLTILDGLSKNVLPLHAHAEAQTPVHQEIRKICSDGFTPFRQRKTAQTSLLKHNWFELKSEIVKWKWTSVSDLFFALVSLSLSLNDVVSDSLVARSFLNGTYYIKDVKTQNDSVVSQPVVSSSECNEVGHNVFTFTQGKIKEEFYRYVILKGIGILCIM